MLIISEIEARKNAEEGAQTIRNGDVLNGPKFNALASPVTARMCGGGEWWIETLDVQTGCMRLDVCGQIERRRFSEVIELIDINGDKHDPDDFWIDAVEIGRDM